MLYLLLVIIFNVVASQNPEIPTLQFLIRDNYSCNERSVIVMDDRPLWVAVKRYYVIQNWSIQRIRCTSTDGQCEVLNVIVNYGSQSTFPEVYPRLTCGKTWSCTLYEGYNNVINCTVHVHYRRPEPAAAITLNGQDVKATTSDISQSEYDAVADYSFEDGETVFIECQASKWAMVKYKSAENSISSDYVSKRLSMILKLTKDSHKSFIECVYDDVRATSVMRLNFNLAPVQDLQSIIRLQINNMIVRPPSNRSVVYQHLYHEGEETEIICALKNKSDTNYLQLDHNGGYYSKSQSKINYTLTLERNHDHTTLRCSALDIATKSNIKEDFQIELAMSSSDFYITGLNGGKILLQYENTDDSSVIHYEYTDNEKLDLTCTSLKSPSFDLRTQIEFLTYGKTKPKNNNNKMYIYHTFNLNASDDNTEIKCRRYLGKAYTNIIIKLFYTTPVVPENNNDGNNDGTTTVSAHDNEDSTTEATGNNDQNKEVNWFLYVSGGGVLVIIVIIVCIAYICKYKRNKRQSNDVNYTNLLSRGDNQPSVEGIQENEPHYQNRMELNTANDEPLVQYAEIMLSNNIAEFKNTDAPVYAQVIGHVQAKKVKTENDYENMGHKARYVNNNVVCEETVEPAYCELMLARK